MYERLLRKLDEKSVLNRISFLFEMFMWFVNYGWPFCRSQGSHGTVHV